MKMTGIRRKLCVTALMSFVIGAAGAKGDTILWISDDSGNVGQIDINTQSVVAGSVHNTGQSLTDIGFDANGDLFGTTFAGLFGINRTTGQATSRGNYPVLGMNALVGTTTAGALLGASFSNNNVYAIDTANAAVSVFKTVGAPSAGDLAFVGSTLYESAISPSGVDELLDVNTNSVVGVFRIGSPNGPTVTGLFGLAYDGTTLYGVSGTNVYSVDVSSAVLSFLFDYSANENGQNLTAATGSDFSTPPSGIPEPASLGLLGVALAMFAMSASVLLRKTVSRLFSSLSPAFT